MMSACLRYSSSRDEALEWVNHAFLKVLQNLKSFDLERPLMPWVKTIAVNTALDACRQKARSNEYPETEDNWEGGRVVSLNHSLSWEENEYMLFLLQALPEKEKEVFNLYAIDGFSHREIAERLGCTERSSIRYLAAARQKLKEKLIMTESGIRKV